MLSPWKKIFIGAESCHFDIFVFGNDAKSTTPSEIASAKWHHGFIFANFLEFPGDVYA